MWIFLLLVLAAVVVGLIAYRRHRAAIDRWKANLEESDRLTPSAEPIFSKATPRCTPRPSTPTRRGLAPGAEPTRPTKPSASARPATQPTRRRLDSSPYIDPVFTTIDTSVFTPSFASTSDDDSFKGHGGHSGGGGASGGWSTPDPTPSCSSPDPTPAASPDPSPSFSDSSPSSDFGGSFNSD